ncbi:MAG: hypothetical protein ACYSTF_07980 [Planctomycetota bacterium]|jgi:hypothetical protein
MSLPCDTGQRYHEPESILFKPFELAKKTGNIVFRYDPLFEVEVDAIVARPNLQRTGSFS